IVLFLDGYYVHTKQVDTRDEESSERDFPSDGDQVTANGLQISFSAKEIWHNGKVNATNGELKKKLTWLDRMTLMIAAKADVDLSGVYTVQCKLHSQIKGMFQERLSVRARRDNFDYNTEPRDHRYRHRHEVRRRGYLGKYLAPATSHLSQSPTGECLSPGGVLFIRYRDTGIQPTNRGANPLNPPSTLPNSLLSSGRPVYTVSLQPPCPRNLPAAWQAPGDVSVHPQP
ncbi:hypothetical protein X777_09190, partial [Ooceraea biroi]